MFRSYFLFLGLFFVVPINIAGPAASCLRKTPMTPEQFLKTSRELKKALDENNQAKVSKLLPKDFRLALSYDEQGILMVAHAQSVHMANLFKKHGLEIDMPEQGSMLLQTVVASSKHESALIELYVSWGADPNHVLPDRITHDGVHVSNRTIMNDFLHVGFTPVWNGQTGRSYERTASKSIADVRMLIRMGALLSSAHKHTEKDGSFCYMTLPWQIKRKMCDRYGIDQSLPAWQALKIALIAATEEYEQQSTLIINQCLPSERLPGPLKALVVAYWKEKEPTYQELENTKCMMMRPNGKLVEVSPYTGIQEN